MKEQFSVEITSVPDRENLVAEVWHDNNLLAEVSNELGELEISIYKRNDGNAWTFQYKELIETLLSAGKKLDDS